VRRFYWLLGFLTWKYGRRMILRRLQLRR